MAKLAGVTLGPILDMVKVLFHEVNEFYQQFNLFEKI